MKFFAGLIIGAGFIVGGYVGGIMGDAFMVKLMLITAAIAAVGCVGAFIVIMMTKRRTSARYDHPRIVIEGEIVEDAPQSRALTTTTRRESAQVRRR